MSAILPELNPPHRVPDRDRRFPRGICRTIGTAPSASRFPWKPDPREIVMSATGLDVFDRTLQITNIWLDEIMETLGPDRQVAWHALGAVLRALRDRLPLGLAVHLGA